MSLPRYNEPSKPISEEKPQEPHYLTNEMKAKLFGKHKQIKPKTASTSQEETMPEQEQAIPTLEQLELMIREIARKAGATTEAAKRDERVCLLAAATLQMCQLLQSFSATTSAEMQKIADREMQNLNIQSQYAASVKASTVEVSRGIYHQFKDEQTRAFMEVRKYLSDTNDEMEKSINACTAEVRKATQSAMQSAKRLQTIKTIGDLLYHAAPLLVLIDIILRIVALVAHIP